MLNKWLQEGENTKVTDFVKRKAETIEGNGLYLVENISKFVGSIKAEKWPHWTELPDFRINSAEQLLKRKTLYGCIEIGTLFRTLCIARGIPSIFVETLRKDWLDSEPDSNNPRLIIGHIFVDVFIDGEWHTIDPGNYSWLHKYEDYSIPDLGKYEVVGKGLDSFDLGFFDMVIFRKIIAEKYKKPFLLDTVQSDTKY